MIAKVASFNFTDINPLHEEQDHGNKMMRTASGRVIIEPGSEKAKIVEAEIQKHPNSLFFRAKAIEANCPNSNGDYFSAEELMDSYKSFEGVPFFTNHDNQNVENARGKVIFAEWVPEEEAVYTICFIDRDAYPHICRSVEEEYVTGVSMGCSVEYSVCNICGNKAERTEDYCTHIRNRKGRKFTGRARNVTTGEVKDFRDEIVFEYNYGLKFIELSAVVDPACPSCHIEGIIPNDNYLARVAQMENDLRMIRVAAINKEASQEEIDQIEQCLGTLEQIAINLIQNRQQVEMEFSSDLVKIMSDLQNWLEELIGAGYGNIGGNVPGTVGDVEEGAPEGGMGAPMGAPPSGAPPAGAPTPTPAAAETPVGTVSGSPAAGATSAPQLPITAPVKPRTSDIEDSRSIQRVSDVSCGIRQVPVEQRIQNGIEIIRKASNICDRINKTGEIEMGARRTIAEKQAQKEKAIEVLSNSWEEKQTFFEYIKQVPSIQNNDHRLSVNKRDDSFIIVAEAKGLPDARMVWTYEDLSEQERKEIKDAPKDAAIKLLETFANSLNKQKEGVKKMTDISKEAGAKTVQETPDQVQEKQLERSDLYHARQNEDKHEITQKQLEALRKGEKDYITEEQLDDSELKQHPREGDAPDVVQEAQMTGDNRLEDEKHEITQKQLPNEGQRVDNEPEVITEKQLSDMAAPWARTAGRDPSMFKSAADHMATVLDVMAESTIKSGCTPEEACSVAASLVDSVESRYNLAVSLLEDAKDKEDIDYAKRVAYWQNKNLKVASTGTKEIAEIIVDGLRSYASDETYNPDVLIDAIDVVSEGEAGIDGISTKVEEKLAEAQEEKHAKVSRKDELRAALNPQESTREARDEDRKQILASIDDKSDEILNPEGIKDADTVIETSFDELGCEKESPDFKKEVVAFTKGALASQSLRMASITNVTISGDTIQIAVQTDTEENEVNIDTGEGTTEIPIGGAEPMAPEEAEQVPEGDMSGEGLEGAWAANDDKMEKTASSDKMTKEAQAPMGGGMPGMEQGTPMGAPEQALPGGAPEGEAIQALTTDAGDEDEIPTAGEKQMPWTVCPECGSTDVDVTNEGGDIKGSCNACTAEYEAMLKKEVEFKIVKPTKSVGEEGAEVPEEPEMPEVPALPVAAQTNINKDTLVRIAKNREEHGHVCPSCGHKKCEASTDEDGHIEFNCPSCGTDVEKDIMINASNPEVSVLRVKWDIWPDVENCEGCEEAVAKFASEVKVANLLKTAAANADDFPMSACMERIAKKYGGDTIATFGPCKGKLLAECACKQLQRLGFRKVRHLNKMASISMAKDPWDECLEDQTENEGHTLKEAEAICGCIKKRFASEWMQNVYAQAFGEDVESGVEKDLTAQDLTTLDEMLEAEKVAEVEAEQQKLAEAEEADIAESLEASEEVVEDETVEAASEEKVVEASDEVEETKEASDETEEVVEASDEAEEVVEAESTDGIEKEASEETEETVEASEEKTEEIVEAAVEAAEAIEEVTEEAEETEEQKQIALAMNGKRVRNTSEEVFKMASTPKQVKDIEGDVEAGVPRSKATIRNEGADNIDVPMAEPSVPRANAEMGNEGADNINPKAGLPDVAVDSSYMGHEKEVQKGYDHANTGGGMPDINNEIKGTVIADSEGEVKEAASKEVKEAKKMKEIDSVEDNVEAGVPRSDATIKNEGADNIDVPMAQPDVPRANAEMGNEGADNINPKADGPDVPVDNAYMGHEKEVQKDMPAINDEMLKQVQQKRQVQLDRIAQARKNEAIQTTAWLVANNRVASDKETFNSVVTALSAFETDQIQAQAERMFPEKQVKTASAKPEQTVEASGHSIPAIVLEPKQMTTGGSDDLTQQLSDAFTIGNTKFDKDLTIYGEK